MQAQVNISRILQRQKNPEGAVDYARRAIAGAEALRARFPHELAYAEKLSRAYLYLGQAQNIAAIKSGSLAELRQVLETYRKSIEIQEAAGPNLEQEWQRSLSTKYFYLSCALRNLGDRTGEVSYYRQALETQLKADHRKLPVADPGRRMPGCGGLWRMALRILPSAAGSAAGTWQARSRLS